MEEKRGKLRALKEKGRGPTLHFNLQKDVFFSSLQITQ
jgi:hypothetical protein